MKKIFLLLCLFCFGFSTYAQQNTTSSKTSTISCDSKKDYIKGDAFKKTCADGSWMELKDRTDNYLSPVTICDSEGNRFEGLFYFYSPYSFANEIYKVNSYNNFWKTFSYNLQSNNKRDYNIIAKDGTKYLFSGKEFNLKYIPDGKGYKVYFCGINAFDVENLNSISSKSLVECHIFYSNGSIECNQESSSSWESTEIWDANIKYADGAHYKGKIQIEKKEIPSLFNNGIEMPNFKYSWGKLLCSDHTFKVYNNGEYDEFNSVGKDYRSEFPEEFASELTAEKAKEKAAIAAAWKKGSTIYKYTDGDDEGSWSITVKTPYQSDGNFTASFSWNLDYYKNFSHYVFKCKGTATGTVDYCINGSEPEVVFDVDNTKRTSASWTKDGRAMNSESINRYYRDIEDIVKRKLGKHYTLSDASGAPTELGKAVKCYDLYSTFKITNQKAGSAKGAIRKKR